MNGQQIQEVYEFGAFQIAPGERLLKRGGEVVSLPPKVIDLLLVLVESNGRVMTKDELMRRVWTDSFVEESNLTHNISLLRRALGEKNGGEKFIETIPRRGYRFVAEVRRPPPAENFEIIAGERRFTSIVTEEELEISDDQTPRAKQISAPPAGFKKRLAALAAIFLLAVGLGVAGYIWKNRAAGSAPAGGSDREFSISRLTATGKIFNAAVSPNGEFLVFAADENEGQSLWLRQTATGSQTRIIAPRGVQYVGLTVSPDNRFVYYSLGVKNQADTNLWRVPILGGAEQRIGEIVTGAAIAFAPDGKQFAYLNSYRKAELTFLELADADGANARLLARAQGPARAFPTYENNPVAWSPAGDLIAVAVYENKDAKILLVNPLDAGERFAAEKKWAYIESVVWLDADTIAISASEEIEGENQIYLISKQTGETRKLTNDLNGYRWLSAAGGNVFAVQKTEFSGLNVAELSGDGIVRKREIVQDSGGIGGVGWTADGAIVFKSRIGGGREIWKISADGANPAQMTIGANATYGLAVAAATGEVVFSATGGGKNSIWKTDAEGKNPRRLTEEADDVFPTVSPDGKTVVFQRGYKYGASNVWRISDDSGAPVRLTDYNCIYPQIAPDAARVACFFMDSDGANTWYINLISVADGKLLQRVKIPEYANQRRLAWHPSGEFVTSFFYENGQVNFVNIFFNDQRPPQIFRDAGRGDANMFAWSPDGKRLAYNLDTETRDVVLIKR
jgi:DNA-binding winged helix-turn-helix (wHTH) protein/Tol biopolymer transport system component